jgi:FKBP-type peptidyl-prolyl cis-trans isomerase FkpA
LKRFFALSALVTLAACGGDSGTNGTPVNGTLQIEDIVVGTGPTVVAGDKVVVNYVGTLTNGSVFDSSAQHGGPQTFQVGVGGLIAGFDQGMLGMKVGGERKLTIPPNLAYGSAGQGPIPPNATLLFDIGLVSIVGK